MSHADQQVLVSNEGINLSMEKIKAKAVNTTLDLGSTSTMILPDLADEIDREEDLVIAVSLEYLYHIVSDLFISSLD